MRFRIATCLISLASLLLAGNPALSETAKAIDAALEICDSLPQPVKETAEVLVEAGWNSDGDAVMAAFASTAFAFLLKPDDIAYSLDNGSFMAASILGNSALPPDQPGFSAGGLRLAILVGDTAKGYCVLSGGNGLLLRLQSAAKLTESSSDEVQSRFEGSLAKSTI